VPAGVAAGTASASGAIGSLISYPALLAIGLSPITANMTNAVAVTAVGIGATVRSGPELRSLPREHAVLWSVLAAVAGAGGAGLLLVTSSDTFDRVVPFLVLLGVVMLMIQPRIGELRPTARAMFPLGLLVVAGYEGYFGAGAGVLTLVVVLLTVERSLRHANAIKNGLLGIADATAGIVFVVAGSVAWSALVPLAVGYLGGGLIGPTVARRLRPEVLRWIVACFGIGLFGYLFVAAFG
jgi:uncharacterized membrane protein YfcA